MPLAGISHSKSFPSAPSGDRFLADGYLAGFGDAGRVLLAVERYKKGDVSLGKAAELAGLPVGQMMTILADFGVESRIETDGYLQGLKNLTNVW